MVPHSHCDGNDTLPTNWIFGTLDSDSRWGVFGTHHHSIINKDIQLHHLIKNQLSHCHNQPVLHNPLPVQLPLHSFKHPLLLYCHGLSLSQHLLCLISCLPPLFLNQVALLLVGQSGRVVGIDDALREGKEILEMTTVAAVSGHCHSWR